MSGPKRADVEAALNIAARSAKASEALIATQESSAAEGVRRKLDRSLAHASGLVSRLRDASRNLDDVHEQSDETRSARRAVDNAVATIDASKRSAEELSSSARQVRDVDEAAQAAFTAAQVEYDAAVASMRQAGSPHYLHAQMAQASEANALFERAKGLATRAAQLRTAAQRSATAVLETANRGVANAERALGASASAVRAAQELAWAAAEAALIAQEKCRTATVALGRARIAVDALDGAIVDKFAPSVRSRLEREVKAGRKALDAELFDGVHSAVDSVPAEAAQVAAECEAAKSVWDAARAAGLAALGDLESLVDATDVDLVESWADDRAAVENARSLVADVQEAMAAEDFDRARAAADAGRTSLATATVSAANAKGQDARRAEIGDAVMDVLEELGFDVSVIEGTRDEPLRISGQTAAVGGRGDFDIEIPLGGELDFEVSAPEGDSACVGAIEALQKKLGERGVAWTVTDWGHAEGTVGHKATRKAQTAEPSTAQARAKPQARGQA